MSLTVEQEQAVLAFVDALRRPVGKRLVALGLRGSKAKPVKRKGLMKNPQHGALAGVPEAVLVRAVEAMLDDGRLVRKGRKYPTVWMPEKRVRPKADPSKPRKPRGPRWQGLEKALADWRTKEARRRRWKAYQVFDNATLKAIAAARPGTLADLEAVPGMGPTRVSRYGQTLLDLVVDHG